MVADLTKRFYRSTTRYTASGFLRVKPGDALNRRQVALHIYDTGNEARAHLRDDAPPA
jgi:propionate CoA-transferase